MERDRMREKRDGEGYSEMGWRAAETNERRRVVNIQPYVYHSPSLDLD